MAVNFRKHTRRANRPVELPHQRLMLRLIAMACVPSCFLFVCFNITRQSYLLASLEGIYGLLAGGILWNIKRLENTRLWTAVLITPLLIIVAYAANAPEATITMFVWVFAVPGVCYLTLGARQGFLFTAGFVAYMAVRYLARVHMLPSDLAGESLVNVVVVVLVIWGFCHVYEAQRVSAYLELETLATRDPLTGLYNRRRMGELFEEERRYSHLDEGNLGLIMIDLDHFKLINDTYGHDVGDDVLRETSALLARNLRAADYAFRMGGEEFCVMLRSVSIPEINQIADTLRSKIESLEVVSGGRTVRVTASLGCTLVRAEDPSLENVMQRVDRLLYAAKEGGRNRVETSGQQRSANGRAPVADGLVTAS